MINYTSESSFVIKSDYLFSLSLTNGSLYLSLHFIKPCARSGFSEALATTLKFYLALITL